MIYEKDQTYSIRDIIQHYFADNECNVENNIYLKIIKETIRKLNELKNCCNLDNVQIKYVGMQKVSHKPVAMIWVFDCEDVISTSFWVKV